MRAHFKSFLIFVFFCGVVQQGSSSFQKSRAWHEEFVPKTGELRRVLYSNYKKCVAPKHKPEKVAKHAPVLSGGGIEETWSYLLSIFSSHGGLELYSWDVFQKQPEKQKISIGIQWLGMAVFITAFFTCFILFTCYIPVVGCFLFAICHLAWSLIFHAEIRRLIRRILITKEKIYIKVRSLLPRKDNVRGKRHFRLPFLFREYAEEEVPAELMGSGEEDSDVEHSSDGFEDLLIRIKGREAHRFPQTPATLLHMMASTEQELDHEDGSRSSMMIPR